ncbi:MAG: NAD-dependent malic enzyme [Candidatus Electrothrix aestuarii]|uniref:NAD-dependent malic enzyme n=1 Tax=Candidatus Electrothrix aestuarii TaxID=3062594 RepID=A0AAU8LSG6_9BACT|nr:NAD-dependent malic enzyme [Candidatus Electrothrix aestuarii]
MSETSALFKYDEYGNTREIYVYASGLSLHSDPFINRGTAFTNDERQRLGLIAMLPPAVRSLEEQVENSRIKVEAKDSDIERFVYIRSLFDRNVTLAHALIKSDISRYMSIIYTPTVGYACQQYSSMFRSANGLHFHPGNIDQAENVLRRFQQRDIRVAVVTDNHGILGLGDQGAGGIAICLGKLMLYTQGAGIAPWHCLPISLDVGTNNEALLNDHEYLGWRHKRIAGDQYIDFIQRFARAFRNVFPSALCQWEDFSKQNAFAIRDTFLHDMISFNDDIQGTGSVALAAIYTAMRIKQEKLSQQKFLIHGAGAGGIGIAEQIMIALCAEGLSEEEARRQIFTLDSRGLITTDRELLPYKQKFAQDPAALEWLREEKDGVLENVVKQAGITVLIGTSGQPGCFSKEVVTALLEHTERPVVMPLSNPTDHAEAVPADIYNWTRGLALVGTGSPFPDVLYEGRAFFVAQANNVFVFPGVGLGALVSGSRAVLPEFFTAAASAVSSCVSLDAMRDGALLPPVTDLSKISIKVAQAVGEAAIAAGVSRPCAFSTFQHNNDPVRLQKLIRNFRWQPAYLPLVAM